MNSSIRVAGITIDLCGLWFTPVVVPFRFCRLYGIDSEKNELLYRVTTSQITTKPPTKKVPAE